MPNALLGANRVGMSKGATHFSPHLLAGNIMDKLKKMCVFIGVGLTEYFLGVGQIGACLLFKKGLKNLQKRFGL